MKLSTRLLVILLPATAAVMAGYAAWSLAEREGSVMTQARTEMDAYATALGLALEDLQPGTLQAVINDLTRSPKIYAVLVYDARGRLLIASDPVTTPAPDERLRAVIADRDSVAFRREIGSEDVFSIIRPVVDRRGAVTGALEVARPLSMLRLEQANIRRSLVLNILSLMAVTTGLTLWVVGRIVDRPLGRLIDAVRALGNGDLSSRVVVVPKTGQLQALGVEFNAMADRLESARVDLVREANERVQLERRLRQTEKMATIGNLAAGLAHEIAAPLHVISGRTEQLLKKEAGSTQSARSLGIVLRQIERINATVRRLLEFGRRREAHLVPVDLGLILDGVVEFLETELARTGVELVRRGGSVVWVVGDANQLHQVFVNLVVNAIQALEGAEEPRRIEIRVLEREIHRATDVVVEVADTGPGIHPEMRLRLFEPFVTTKAHGTGLGLVVAQSILEEHGGQLEACAGDPKGAVFRLRLREANPQRDRFGA